MSENRPGQSSVNMQAAERCTSPQSSVGVRKSARLLKPSLLYTHQDSAASTSSNPNPLPSPTTDDGEVNAATSSTKDAITAAAKQRKGKVWDPATENLFFEALKTYGKDYDNIVKYITQKSKSKTSGVKNYEQVRNYYHNTTTKILGHVDLSEIDASKEVKELFALINYGEWKRKTNNPKVNGKWLKPFTNLVMNGWTVIKLRGSTKPTGKKKRSSSCMIRTPMCPALRRLLEGKDDIPIDTNVPKNVTIELSPSSQRDRAYVLGCWQNPFIRFELNLNQPLSEWLRWLQNKWIPQDLRARRTLLGEDISSELANVTLYPSADMVLRAAKLNPAGTKSISASTSASNSAPSANSASSAGLGLRYYCGSKSASSLTGRPEQWPPSSPGKNDRKRRKSTPVVNETEQACAADVVPTNIFKRFRSDLASPVPDDGAGIPGDLQRQFSDGGDGESSCDACPMVGAVIEVEGDSTESGTDQKPPPKASSVQVTEENEALEKPDVIIKESINRQQQQQLPHLITLDPDLLRNGLNTTTCGSLTVGQLCLMCDKARLIRLKYAIVPKSNQTLVNAVDSWSFFVNLVRSNFIDSVGKKVHAPSINRVVSPPANNASIAAASMMNQTSADGIVGTAIPSEDNTLAILKTLDKAIDEQRRQQQRTDAAVDEVFAAPQAVNQSKKKMAAKETTKADPQQAAPMSRAAYFVGEESNAFLQQMGQMIKKPVVVNRKRAVVVATPAIDKLPVSWTVNASQRNQYQRQNSDQGRIILVHPPTAAPTTAAAVVTEKLSVGQSSVTNESVHTAVTTESQLSVASQLAQSILRSQLQPATPIPGNGSTLNTPDVSLMRSSPDPPVCEPSMVQSQELVSDLPNQESSAAGSSEISMVVAPAGVQQDIITSDSFLDFSLGSFPGFGMKSMGSPKRFVEKEPILNVIHSLRLEPDDSALSSPPRPIKAGAMQRNDVRHSTYQPGAISNSNQFPSTSNLFPLLDSSVDNESSNTRNFFAACAMASALETPEKCKDDDRR